jgi:4-carboxymuconolactone decarboxylase
MSRLTLLTPETMNADQAKVYETITAGDDASISLKNPDGSLVGPFNMMTMSPKVGDRLRRLGGALLYASPFSARARELVILAVAAHYESAFERSAHEQIGRASGLTDEEMTAVAAKAPLQLSDPVEACLLTTSRLLLANEDLADAEYNAAKEVIGEQAMVDLVTLVGFYSLTAIQLRVFRVPG